MERINLLENPGINTSSGKLLLSDMGLRSNESVYFSVISNLLINCFLESLGNKKTCSAANSH